MNPAIHSIALRDILEHPEDDTPRLIYADLLEDQGESDRADFIRSQIAKGDLSYNLQYKIDKYAWRNLFGVGRALDDLIDNHINTTGKYLSYSWGSSESPTGPGLYKCGAAEVWIEYKDLFKLIMKRGWPSRIRCNLETWIGKDCGCRNNQGFPPHDTSCKGCSGSGRELALGPKIVKIAPIETVIVNNKEPTAFSDCPAMWERDMSDLFHEEPYICGEYSRIPGIIFDHMVKIWEKQEIGEPIGWYFMIKRFSGWKFESKQEAIDVLSVTLIEWAKSCKNNDNLEVE